jgi:2-polyprenyl-3-methyl-5-hydroxy-6-metoxy-1,4-benzoquinol methylase
MIKQINIFHPISNVILHLIGNGKKVLDVGCSTGKLGEKLRIDKCCFVVGIEVDKARADVVKHRLNDVMVANVEELKQISYPEGFFDVIIFADVAEPLRSPKKALGFFREYLKDGSFLIASIPNVANWTVRLKLLFGKWNYKERGLLARNHLRFFTLKTTKAFLEEAGFAIEKITCTSSWSRLDWKLPFKNPANLWKSLLACNFVIKAFKKVA